MALHYVAENALEDLLTAWRHYDDVRRREERKFSELGRARTLLDDARDRMHRIRAAIHPNAEEHAAAVKIALCPNLDEIVYLSWNNLIPGDRHHLKCICGHLVEL